MKEHIAFKTWPLVAEWSTPKLMKDSASEIEPRLIRLKFTYKFNSEFGEPCDEWLEAIEEKRKKILGNYNKKEDEALSVAFEAHKKALVKPCI